MTTDSPSPALIEVNGLSASYGHVAALKPIDLRVEEAARYCDAALAVFVFKA